MPFSIIELFMIELLLVICELCMQRISLLLQKNEKKYLINYVFLYAVQNTDVIYNYLEILVQNIVF